MKGSVNPLANVLVELSSVEQLCIASTKKAEDLSVLMKKVYDFASFQGCKAGSIDELIIENVDAETIWEELNSRNLPLVRQLTSRITKLNRSIEEVQRASEETDEESQQDEADEDDASKSEDNESAHGNISGSAEDEENESDGGIPELSDDEDETENADVHDGHSESDMEKWLDDMDEAEMRRNDGDYESDEDDIYVSNALYEDEEGDADYRYSDYFQDGDKDVDDYDENNEDDEGGDDGQDEQDDDDVTEGDDSDEMNDNNATDDDYDDDDDEDNYDDNKQAGGKAKKASEQLSAFQSKNQKLSSQISDLESQLIKEKSWDMKGEVKASERPENSLLEMYADIERLSKPTPVITEASTNDLEAIIKDRIKNGRFNDVPVYREPEADKKPSDNFELSQAKNTTGLGELYAQEFLAKALNSQPDHVSNKLAAAREDALALYHKVSMKLDELSHFFFSPRPVSAEINVKSYAPIASLPSINLEEVVPLVGSSASQNAPEEVMAKKRGRSGEDLTKADKKRLRKLRGKTDEKGDGTENDKKSNRKSGGDSDDDIINDRRVTTGSSKGGDGGFSKSATFFANLQSNAQAEISGMKSALAAEGKQKKEKALRNKNYKL